MSGEWGGLRAAAEAASAEMDRLTSAPGGPGQAWRWSIPANPERDSDLIFDEVIRHVPALLDRLQAAEAAVERVRDCVQGWSADGHYLWERMAARDIRDALDGPQDAATGEVASGYTDVLRVPEKPPGWHEAEALCRGCAFCDSDHGGRGDGEGLG